MKNGSLFGTLLNNEWSLLRERERERKRDRERSIICRPVTSASRGKPPPQSATSLVITPCGYESDNYLLHIRGSEKILKNHV